MLKVLIDCSRTHSFLNDKLMLVMQGITSIKPVLVKIVDGALLYCTAEVANFPWTSEGNTFHSNFRFLWLGSYDTTIGLDWLTQHSPMEVD